MSVVAPKSVEATIVDDGGTLVAQRTLTDRTDRNAKVCLPLARAVGAWASLVLDAELAHAKDDDGSEPTPVSLTSTSSSAPITRSLDDQPRDRPSSIEGDGAPTKERHAVELGTMFSIGNGLTPNGGFAGLSPFVTIEVATSWLLRPSVVFGRTTSAITESTGTMSHVGARADFCRRVPGNYVERRGIEADFCLGVEGGVIASDGGATSPIRGDVGRLGLGPSATLRGELGAGLALEVRGILGANLLNQSIGDEGVAPLVFATGEIGLSVRLP